MANIEPTMENAPLFVYIGKSYASEPGRRVVIIAGKPEHSVQIDGPRTPLRVESAKGQRQLVPSSPNGMFRRQTTREFGGGHQQNNCPHGRSHERQDVDV
jgi:hypothetical protein